MGHMCPSGSEKQEKLRQIYPSGSEKSLFSIFMCYGQVARSIRVQVNYIDVGSKALPVHHITMQLTLTFSR